ncbi:NAD-dependent dehydratase [Halomonas sp. ND22Bw]|uniref:UDP-glucose 4-epimerase family protein n=1 Tax=Halomonas sp. ND22Bw TaxID=2054178 RepID=UPI000D0BC2C9|nr:NAD-dependent dehydratase [Halomonas sp. ND22Bw]
MSDTPAARILVTGATGFVGSGVVERLAIAPDREPLLGLRREPETPPMHAWAAIGELSPDNDCREALRGCQAVVHCAARVHVMDDPEADPLTSYRRANVQGTLNLARQAAQAGVSRFIFISSIKVNGESTNADGSFTADASPEPGDAYGLSKFEAEQGLLALSEETGLEVVIIRPPLVYGPGVKANFASMMRWLSRGVPLPLGAIHNRRSLVARANLVDLIVICLEHPAAANQIFLAADGDDLSTTELLRRLGDALGMPARLVPAPAALLELGASLLGKRAVAQRLCGSLCVDIDKTRKVLGWEPPVSVDQALRETAEAYRQSTLPS